MRIILLANNWAGWKAAEYLAAGPDEIVGLVAHPAERAKFGPEIAAACRLPPERVFLADRLRDKEVLEALAALRPDLGLSVFFGYILKPDCLGVFPGGCVNVHPAFLPYNRGAFPNVWPIIDDTPAGVTIHYLDRGVDTGDIISQRRVPVQPWDTGASLYRRLENECQALFQETWPLIRAGRAPRRPQSRGEGTAHRVRDAEAIDAIDLDRTYGGRELIDILRARTFPPFRGAFIENSGRKIYLELKLTCEPPPAET